VISVNLRIQVIVQVPAHPLENISQHVLLNRTG